MSGFTKNCLNAISNFYSKSFNEVIEGKSIEIAEFSKLLENIYRSIKNIPNTKLTDVNHFSSFDIIKYNKLILTVTSVKELEEKYS